MGQLKLLKYFFYFMPMILLLNQRYKKSFTKSQTQYRFPITGIFQFSIFFFVTPLTFIFFTKIISTAAILGSLSNKISMAVLLQLQARIPGSFV